MLPMTMHKKLTRNVRLAVVQRLRAFLADEERQYKSWQDNISRKMPPSKAATVSRAYRKRVQSLKIVIWMLTPRDLRDDDVPVMFERGATE